MGERAVNRPKEESPFEEEVRVSFFKRLGIVNMPLHDALRCVMVVCWSFLDYHRLKVFCIHYSVGY